MKSPEKTLRFMRRLKYGSLEEAARATGIPARTLWRCEQGRRARRATREAIEKAFAIEFAELSLDIVEALAGGVDR